MPKAALKILLTRVWTEMDGSAIWREYSQATTKTRRKRRGRKKISRCVVGGGGGLRGKPERVDQATGMVEGGFSDLSLPLPAIFRIISAPKRHRWERRG